MRILFTGGGTLGPVTPLLALAESFPVIPSEVEGSRRDFLWLGTRQGPEQKVIEAAGIRFAAIPSAKLRRYFDGRTFLAPFSLCAGFFAALYHIVKFKPDAIVTAGGYVGVPVVIAGWILRVPSLMIQLDLKPVLSNLIAAPFARRIAVTFAGTLRYFPKNKTIHTGAPVRLSVVLHSDSRIQSFKQFHLDTNLPTVLVLGGGTGALRLNELIDEAIPEIIKHAQILHLTGPGKLVSEPGPRYYPVEFLQEMDLAYAVADLVVCRAGIGTLSEVAAIGLPTIFIPIPKTSQVDNARALEERGAAVVMDQNKTSPAELAERVVSLLLDDARRNALGEKIKNLFPQNATLRLVEEVLKL